MLDEFNIVDDLNIRNKCMKFINEEEILKSAWPPKAVPSDVGYGGSGMLVNRSLLSEREIELYDLGMSTYKVNQLASDLIPLRRDITLNMPDPSFADDSLTLKIHGAILHNVGLFRESLCNNLTYDTSSLPTAGVVLIFTDEMWSALMRTVFSILDAGPSHLITEIILVDDASQRDHLGKPLDDYLRIFRGKVKVVRMPQRKGLIAARLLGFEHVTGEVAVFLDSHCEVAKGWLEPLLHRIKHDDSVVAVPHIDVLKWDTFQYFFTPNKNKARCGFEFDMKYTWEETPLPDGIKRKSFADPIETAVHMGCCFATSKKNFERLGRYDPDLEIWGCENLELSFKTWMCGGRLEIIPCAHIAHMYRPKCPYNWVGKPFIYERNCLRVADVWMDQYKQFYQDRISNLQNNIDIGDVSQRKALREKLKCHSFDWYIKEIFPDIYIPINTTAIGRISSLREPLMCITTDLQNDNKNNPAHLEICSPQNQKQYHFLTKERQIRRDNGCFFHDKHHLRIMVKKCKDDKGQWQYQQDNTIELLGTNQCISLLTDNTSIELALCNSSDRSQQWSWPRKSIVLT